MTLLSHGLPQSGCAARLRRLDAGYVVVERGVGGRRPAAGPFLQADPEADHHDVLPLLGVAHGLDRQFALEPNSPLGAVDDEQPSGVGAVAGVGDLAVGVGRGICSETITGMPSTAPN